MRLFALLMLTAASAQAAANDLRLFLLGHPDPLPCTRCDGSPGDVPEPGTPGAQARFHRLASTLGLAFVPPFQETAGTIGQAGFEVGFSSSEAFLRIDAGSWPTVGTQAQAAAPNVLVLPTVTIRKGLGGSLELGAAVSWLVNSQMTALSAELRWAPVDGIASAPDIALRAFATRLIGTQDLDLALGGADFMLSKSFGVAGTLKLQPYGTAGITLINALSNVVDFKPNAQDPARPGLDNGVFHSISLLNNRYFRGALGVRLVAGALVLGVEGSVAVGRNRIQDDAIAGGTPSNYVRLWSGAGRLGFSF